MNPLLPIERLVLLAAVLLALAGYTAWRSAAKVRTGIRGAILAARLLAVLCLALVAANPGTWHVEHETDQTEWAILLDRSLSMATRDVGAGTRWEAAWRLATRSQDLAHEACPVRLYPFAERLGAPLAADATAPVPDGAGTDLERAGRELLGRYRTGGKRLTGVVLLSDGRQVGGAPAIDVAVRARAMDVPIFALPLGGPVRPRDLLLRTPHKQRVAFAGQDTRLTVVLSSQGFGRISPDVTLRGPEGTELGRQRVNLAPDGEQSVSFDIQPPEPGHHVYRLAVQPWEGEARTANNEVTVGVSVIQSAIRVYVAEGAPYWDSKFLVQLLRKQPHMAVTSVYRLAANRFFRVDTDTTETSESEAATFPETAEALADYDVVVMGKGAEYFLTPERIRALTAFIRDQGGCLVFSRGKPYHGEFPALAGLEPVTWGAPVKEAFRLQPTATGAEVGLFGDRLPAPDDAIWPTLPTLDQAHRCASVRAFTQVLVNGRIEAAGRTQDFPALVARRHGKGLVVLCNADGLWRWDFFASRPAAGQLYQDLWAQLLQWAITYSEFLPGQPYAIHLDTSAVQPDRPVQVRVLRRGRGNGPYPTLVVRSGAKVVAERTAGPETAASQQWDLSFAFTEPGPYTFELQDDASGEALQARGLLEVLAPPSEQDNVSADGDALADITRLSGGRIVTEAELMDLLEAPPPAETRAQPGKTTWQPTWDRGWMLCLVSLFFAVEWFLRRRHGLL